MLKLLSQTLFYIHHPSIIPSSLSVRPFASLSQLPFRSFRQADFIQKAYLQLLARSLPHPQLFSYLLSGVFHNCTFKKKKCKDFELI